MVDVIRGKVARILNSREVVLNIGLQNGVELGMYFDILDSKLERIIDPDTGHPLGSVSRPKVHVKISYVEGALSIASTYKEVTVNRGGVGVDIGVFARAFLPPRLGTRYETLRTSEKTWEDLDESASYINTGDPVVQVFASDDV